VAERKRRKRRKRRQVGHQTIRLAKNRHAKERKEHGDLPPARGVVRRRAAEVVVARVHVALLVRGQQQALLPEPDAAVERALAAHAGPQVLAPAPVAQNEHLRAGLHQHLANANKSSRMGYRSP
jgi:hypothetical protein